MRSMGVGQPLEYMAVTTYCKRIWPGGFNQSHPKDGHQHYLNTNARPAHAKNLNCTRSDFGVTPAQMAHNVARLTRWDGSYTRS